MLFFGLGRVPVTNGHANVRLPHPAVPRFPEAFWDGPPLPPADTALRPRSGYVSAVKTISS